VLPESQPEKEQVPGEKLIRGKRVRSRCIGMSLNKMRIIVGVAMIAISLITVDSRSFGDTTPQKGDVLPDITIPVPQNNTDKDYLGLKAGAFFKIPQIKAEVVIIEIFSMYCPYCQREAPEVNRLYNLIEHNPGLKGKIKMIGLGPGNTKFEVQVFKKNYNVPFPLVPDEDFSLHKSFGEVRTPYFFGVKINNDGTHRVFYSELGGLQGAERFLGLMVKLSGLNPGGAQ
jgi:peroxiredoxin